MDWPFLLIAGVVFAAWLLWKRSGCLDPKAARQFLQEGALLIDVRTASEFGGGHLPGARNIPLDVIAERLPAEVQDQEKVILLYCASGTRSGFAKSRLQRLGYRNVHNLGSFGRARSIQAG
jgi:phage shock protein E